MFEINTWWDVERVGCEGVHCIQLGHYRVHEGIFWGRQ